METVSQQLFERKLETLSDQDYMLRISAVNLPCQWLIHCDGGKCPAFRLKTATFTTQGKQSLNSRN
jgi:hypothetical protein